LEYDTKEGILSYLKRGLAGLNELVRARGEAGYERREQLNKWIVAGRYHMDSCGNTGLCFIDKPDYSGREVMNISQPVISRQEMLDRKLEFTVVFGTDPPKPDEVCPICLSGWMLEDCHDSKRCSYGRWEGRCVHPECAKAEIAKSQLADFKQALQTAGCEPSGIREIPNEYWNDDSYNVVAPWYEVTIGNAKLKMGWRKRVISVEILEGWEMPQQVIDDLKEKNITVWQTGFHAWGYDKFEQTLWAVREHNC